MIGFLVGTGPWALASDPVTEPPDALAIDPAPHPLVRYGDLWDSGWFISPQEDAAPEIDANVPEEPFPYRLVGLADLRARQWVYLVDETGDVLELTFGRPADGLALVRIEGAESGAARPIVQIRQGGRLIRLEMPTEGPAFVRSDPKAKAPAPPPSVPTSLQWRREIFSKK